MLLKQVLNHKYEINDPVADLIGSGAMGFVYRGRDLESNEHVAIKALKPDATNASFDMITRFLREGDALRDLNHPNIVKVLDTIRDKDAPQGNPEYFIVMEYIDGGTLEQLLSRRKHLQVNETLELGLDLADALTRAHRLGIVHRDVKPGNVLMANDKTPRLTDFGMAHISKKSSLTEDGTLIGTIDYLSPEALNAKNLDERADIWSFGVLLWEMLIGRPPFRRDSVGATLVAILSDPLPSVRDFCSDAPERLGQLLSLMLEKDRERRIPSMRHIGAELEAILQGRDVREKTSWDQVIATYNSDVTRVETQPEEVVPVDVLTSNQMVSMMIANSQSHGEQFISLPSLAFASTIREDLVLDDDSAALMLRSALYHSEPYEPWLHYFDSGETASEFLKEYYDSYPPPEVRDRIVDALGQIDDGTSIVILNHIVARDDSPEIRTKAALESARHGNYEEVIRDTLAEVREGGNIASLATLAALVDEYGLPEDSDIQLKLQLSFVLARQRWKRYRYFVRKQSFRVGKYGLLMVFGGAASPILMNRMDPESYQLNLEALGLPTWLLSLIVFFGLYGFLQGVASGFFPGLADATWIGGKRRYGRFLLSSPAGLVYSLIMILFLGLQPDQRFVQRVLYIPLTILLGLLVGALLSMIVPVMGQYRHRGQQLTRMVIISLLCMAINVPYLFFLFPAPSAYLIFSRLFFVGLLALVIGLTFLVHQEHSEIVDSVTAGSSRSIFMHTDLEEK